MTTSDEYSNDHCVIGDWAIIQIGVRVMIQCKESCVTCAI